jgi:Domain of unknown function (DUF4394)
LSSHGVNTATSNAVTAGTGLAALAVNGYTSLYTVDLTTGAAPLVGPIGAGSVPIQGLAAQGAVIRGALPAIALSADGTQLVRFDTSTPTTAVDVAVTGVTPGEVLVGIDWRPQTGQLFASE